MKVPQNMSTRDQYREDIKNQDKQVGRKRVTLPQSPTWNNHMTPTPTKLIEIVNKGNQRQDQRDPFDTEPIRQNNLSKKGPIHTVINFVHVQLDRKSPFTSGIFLLQKVKSFLCHNKIIFEESTSYKDTLLRKDKITQEAFEFVTMILDIICKCSYNNLQV